MRPKIKFSQIIAAFVLAAVPFPAIASFWITEFNTPEDSVLFDSETPASIFLDANCAPSVARACKDLGEDVKRVVGLRPEIISDSPGLGSRVIVGTLGTGGYVDRLVASGRLDTNGISGQWESYILQMVTNDTGQSNFTLVIAGSDARGTIYGIYRLSEMMGVSPWYWWSDVPVNKKKRIAAHGDLLKQGPPAVKYRGIFLDDEECGLRPWAAKTFEPENDNIGPKTYGKVFELLLRLRANLLWPAMHPGTASFNSFPENRELAASYGVVMGSSPCEQMLCNNSEWDDLIYGKYDLATNFEGAFNFWEQRAHQNGKFENVYTLGMCAANGGAIRETEVPLGGIIRRQRELLARVVNKNVQQVPQVFFPTQAYPNLYSLARDITEDITLIWEDDGHGYIRQFSNPMQQRRSGGAGVYYMSSGHGAPGNSLRLNSTAPGLIAEEMTKAYDLGASRLWMLDVGCLKPGEIGAEYFLKLAWSPHKWIEDSPSATLDEQLARDFGANASLELASILNEYYRLCFLRKPGDMNVGADGPLPGRSVFSSALNGDEIEQRLQAWRILVTRAFAASDKLPPDLQDAFFEMIGFPVQTAAAMNEKGLLLAEFIEHKKQGRSDTAFLLNAAREAHEKINRLAADYNTKIAEGKWKGLMSEHPCNESVFSVTDFPETSFTNQTEPMGLVMEGSEEPVYPWTPDTQEWRLPQFNSLVPRTFFVDVFNGSGKPWIWSADTRQNWLLVTPSSGGADTRVLVAVDWEKAPSGDNVKGQILFSSGGRTITVATGVHNPSRNPAVQADFAEDNGSIVIQAEHASRFGAGLDAQWKVIPNLGYNYGVVTAVPATATVRETPEEIVQGSPRLEYKIYVNHQGEWRVHIRTLPTFSVQAGKPQRYAISFDSGVPQIAELPVAGDKFDALLQENVLRNAAVTTTVHNLSRGLHTLKLWMVDPGIVFDCIAARSGSEKSLGYVWPMETRILSGRTE